MSGRVKGTKNSERQTLLTTAAAVVVAPVSVPSLRAPKKNSTVECVYLCVCLGCLCLCVCVCVCVMLGFTVCGCWFHGVGSSRLPLRRTAPTPGACSPPEPPTFGAQPTVPSMFAPFFPLFFFLAPQLVRSCWPKSVWPKSVVAKVGRARSVHIIFGPSVQKGASPCLVEISKELV